MGRAIGRVRLALRVVDRALTSAGPADRAALLRERGNLLDAQGVPDQAFAAWAEADAFGGGGFDRVAHRAALDALVARTRGRRWTSGPHPDADRVVLLVGPPASGVGLLERALAASVPGIVAGGPSTALRELGDVASGPFATLPEAERATLRARYLALLGGDASQRVTDRGPDNLVRLDLVAALLPGARVVRCVRDRDDVAFACFRAGPGANRPWAHDLGDIRAWLEDVERLADHWEAELPLRFHTVSYEALVRDPLGVLGGVAAFLGRPAPVEAPAFLHTRSIGRSRRYARHLEVTCPR
ncbi:MAG: sulfotransferase [Myxococcota bacterium]